MWEKSARRFRSRCKNRPSAAIHPLPQTNEASLGCVVEVQSLLIPSGGRTLYAEATKKVAHAQQAVLPRTVLDLVEHGPIFPGCFSLARKTWSVVDHTIGND